MAVEVRVLGPVEVVHLGSAVRVPRAERTLLAALASRLGAVGAPAIVERNGGYLLEPGAV